jgi:hypothetical protein
MLSSLREVAIVEFPLGGTKIHHEIDTSNSNKELVSKNLDLPPSSS